MTGDGAITWRELEREARASIEAALGGDRSREARWIIERASGWRGAELVRSLDDRVAARSVAFLDRIVARRAGGEPLQYALGVWSFRTLELVVDRRVLIPRPETELVAGIGIDHLRACDRHEPLALDLGTGSGAIGLSIAVEVPRSQVVLADRSPDALAVARANLSGLGRSAARVRIVESDWFDELPGELRGRLELVIANPPYVASAADLDPIVAQWEPPDALIAAGDGLADIAEIVEGAPAWLAPGGALVVEHGADQGPAARGLAERAGLRSVRTATDLAGRDRALVARMPR
jgi:release factor glutamine methyltransferase